MTLYTRHQLLVLLVLLGAGGLGLAVGQWRRAHPDLVDRLEMLDRTPAPPAGREPTGTGDRDRRDPFPPTGNGPRVPGWSEAATGQRTRAAWSRDSCRPCPSAPRRGARAVIVDMTSQTKH
jgi:hypothetical protein